MKSVIILGSTGSIGTQALQVVRQYPDKLSVAGLCCNGDIDALLSQINEFKPKYVAVGDEEKAARLTEMTDVPVWGGEEGVNRLAACKCDVTLNALVGIRGLQPTINAINAGNDVALANKETLVAGGDIVMPLAKSKGVSILPVDSEHSAIWQCKGFDLGKKVNKVILTASGGAFRDKSKQEIACAKACDALRHPTWNMGSKVTVDSATLVNKGLEIIEAKHLFDVDPKDIEVYIHPQSIVHSMVKFDDGSISAQMSFPDMKLPITLALLYPDRGNVDFSPLQLDGLDLSFKKPDYDRFPCLGIAMQCAQKGGVYPIIFNAVNEVLVPFYLDDKIKFYDFSYYIERAMQLLGSDEPVDSIATVYRYDQMARSAVEQMLKEI
ncbi:MAG: 1-deoxy-D-xylulose-5-phosphate reductoisomerase [Christensenellales bacterium]